MNTKQEKELPNSKRKKMSEKIHGCGKGGERVDVCNSGRAKNGAEMEADDALRSMLSSRVSY